MKTFLHNKALTSSTKTPSDLKLCIGCQTGFQVDKSDPVCIWFLMCLSN